ncbi:hypothetical protein FNV43_RR02100 [Rhamnella rubrinervis]|uniref:Uncharacterized protein n=1 Tax=Rhamnella rubrinervis TaxID=2594499 RepID=A0A8K0HQV2_9ROSA|nr:hypothetical protein FNV43_RR02100 [Rhamnella rubrinervis]
MESKVITHLTLQNKFESLSESLSENLSEKKGVRRWHRKRETARSESEFAPTLHPLDSEGMREHFSPLPDAVPPSNLENQNNPLRDTVFPSGLEDHNNDELKDSIDKMLNEKYLCCFSELEESGDGELRCACTIASAIYHNKARLLKFEGSKSCKDRETFEKLKKVQDELCENFCKWKASHI